MWHAFTIAIFDTMRCIMPSLIFLKQEFHLWFMLVWAVRLSFSRYCFMLYVHQSFRLYQLVQVAITSWHRWLKGWRYMEQRVGLVRWIDVWNTRTSSKSAHLMSLLCQLLAIRQDMSATMLKMIKVHLVQSNRPSCNIYDYLSAFCVVGLCWCQISNEITSMKWLKSLLTSSFDIVS